MMKNVRGPLFLLLLVGCAGAAKMAGGGLEAPPEFKQKIILDVADDYKMYQAPRSGYDVGDLQSFHTQHTLPVVVEDAFKEIFGEVEILEKGPRIEGGAPEVPAVFEVRLIDLANDVYMEADTYRSELTLAVAMKSPRGNIFWQKAFRGEGYVKVDPQFSTGLGPQDAVVDALRDGLHQMQKALLSSPEVRTQMRYYLDIQRARRERETGA